MNRKLKTLGIALVAALALTAVMASTSQAFFTSSASNTTLTGTKTKDHVFTAGSGVGAVTCETAHFHSSENVGTQASTITIKPTYGPTCKDSLGRVVHVTSNTLLYHFNTPTAGVGTVTLTGHIQLTVTSAATGATICTITIEGPQTVNNVAYKNLGGTNGVEVTTTTNNITSSISGGFFNCGTSATHSSTGTYSSTTVVKGESGGKAVEVSVD